MSRLKPTEPGSERAVRSWKRRSRARSKVIRTSLGIVVAGFVAVGLASPAGAQVVNEGTQQESLQCVPVVVDGVDPEDSLNVRLGPGVAFDIVQTLDPGAPATATGLTEQVGSGTWYQIGVTSCEPTGWVNSRFLELAETSAEPVPTTATTQVADGQEAAEEPVTPNTSTAPPAEGDSNGIQLSLFAIGLLSLGLAGLFVGAFMAYRGRRPNDDGGPPPGMTGPPGGPYYLARVDQQEKAPETIQVGGVPKPAPSRRGTDLPSEPIDEPLSAFPSVPDLASEFEKEAEKMTRPTMRLFGTKSLAAGNATETEKGS